MARLLGGTAVLVAGLAWAAGPARAEHAFLCEGGRIAYASDASLERLKREDPCVAAYYGLTVAAKPTAPGAQAAAPGAPIATGEPAGAAATATAHRSTEPAATQLRPSSAREVARASRRIIRSRFHEVNEQASLASASPPPAPLKVINAGHGPEAR